MAEKEIIECIFALLEGRATPGEEERVRDWLREDGRHQHEYEEVAEIYYKLNGARAWEKIDTAKAVLRVKESVSAGKSRIRRWYFLSSVAALCIVFLGVWALLQTEEKEADMAEIAQEEVKSGEMKAMLTLADGKQVELSSGAKVDVDLGFARAVEDSLKGLVYCFKDSVTAPEEYHTLSVPRGGEYIMVLSDGTRVWLNSETELKFPVNFNAAKRVVHLTGEAYFEVVKDVRRPFVVETPGVKTTVLGTSFNVMAYKGEEQTEITLVSGAVAVKAGKRECRIVPGQQAAVDNVSQRIDCREVNSSYYASWKDGVFDFDNMTLSELCVKLGRWYDVDFFFVNQVAAEKCFTGAVKRNKSLQFMLDFVQKTSGVHFEVKGKTVTVYNN